MHHLTALPGHLERCGHHQWNTHSRTLDSEPKTMNPWQVDGGRPMAIDGPLVICDRADHMPGRTFDGSVAQLSIYDAALTETDVRALT